MKQFCESFPNHSQKFEIIFTTLNLLQKLTILYKLQEKYIFEIYERFNYEVHKFQTTRDSQLNSGNDVLIHDGKYKQNG